MANNISLASALHIGKEILFREQDEAMRSAEILMQFVLQRSRAYLYSHPEQVLTVEQIHHYQELIVQRQQGMPIAYLIGRKSFWTFELEVSEATLIPRPETELLIERSLELADAHLPLTVLDLGTGTGAIALALASERPHWKITACDFSQMALDIAMRNAHYLQLPVQFILSNWFEAFAEKSFDIIIANPPYLASTDTHLDQGDIRFEPRSALVSGEDGLNDLRLIIQQSRYHLNENGLLLVEHGYDQGNSVSSLFHKNGYKNIQTWIDRQNHPRVCSGKYRRP